MNHSKNSLLPGMKDVMAAMQDGNLIDATQRLQAMLGMPAAASPAALEDVIDLTPQKPGKQAEISADFTLQQFKSPHGTLDYRLHCPPSLPKGAPLLIMLHGCTQDSADFARGTRMNALAEAAGFAVLYPEQSAAANPRRCWRWFEAAHQKPLSGEPALLLALSTAVAKAHDLDANAFYIAGMSAGGAMAAVLADSADPRIAAIAVHSGVAAAAASNMASGLGAMRQPGPPRRRKSARVPTLVLHGSADTTVVPANADLLFDQAVMQSGGALTQSHVRSASGERTQAKDAKGRRIVERYLLAGLGHAWAGGDPKGSHTSPHSLDASRHIIDFMAEIHSNRGAG